MIDQELLEILVCPETKEPVHLADAALIERVNARIAAGQLTNRGGAKLEKAIDGGLVRADGAYLYPIDDGIPIMLIDEAIPLRGIAAAGAGAAAGAAAAATDSGSTAPAAPATAPAPPDEGPAPQR